MSKKQVDQQVCTCQPTSDTSRNSSHTVGCPKHCTHYGIDTARDEWHCICGASHEDLEGAG